jgi:hypothetical protein
MKALLKKILPRALQRQIRTALYGRYYVLQQETEGLLSPKHYERLHDEVCKMPDLDLVEVGGAGGTASIAMAWALQEQGRKSKLVVVEKCEGGSRSKYGGRQENLARFERNIAAYGVDGKIRLFPHYMTFENGKEVLNLIETPEIGALVLDADGWIHRDFHFLWPRLRVGGLIVVDDYEAGRDEKHELTYQLLNYLMAIGLFEKVDAVGATVFGRKPAGGSIEKLDLALAQGIVERVSRDFGSRTN